MCGISGIITNTNIGSKQIELVERSIKSIAHRGPDSSGIYQDDRAVLGHRRLSIIDTSTEGKQPMTDVSGRYTIVFNGEIYNFSVYRKLLEAEGVEFRSKTDTEVLLYLYIKMGAECLKKLSGFFAFCIWDNLEKKAFIARDRMGIKPLYWHKSEHTISFSSEMKGIMNLDIPKVIDRSSLFSYLQLNYIPYPNSIFCDVYKLYPGHYLEIDTSKAELDVEPVRYYAIPTTNFNANALNPTNYSTAQNTLISLLDTAVQKRMIADVPLGTFLSGGIDSSVISYLASRHTDNLNTFSIGFKDNDFYDETAYSQLVAEKIKSNHHAFQLTSDDFYNHIDDYLDHVDEPFADSSGLNVFILSKETRNHVTVALSGDGADEMFSGYNKHFAEYKMRHQKLSDRLAVGAAPVLKLLPQNRDSKISNLNRQLQRFSEGVNLSNRERYWSWATFRNEEKANYLLLESIIENEQRLTDAAFAYKKRKEYYLKHISKSGNFNEVLYTDMQLVLPNDMLYKVDMNSMAHSLEVRTPFLDSDVVDFAFQIPVEFKINSNTRKKILKDAFRKMLPEELYNRPKKGFEIPLLDWLTGGLKERITNDYLNPDFIADQGLFNMTAVETELTRMNSNNPKDSAGTIWNLLVFQHWYKKHML